MRYETILKLIPIICNALRYLLLYFGILKSVKLQSPN